MDSDHTMWGAGGGKQGGFKEHRGVRRGKFSKENLILLPLGHLLPSLPIGVIKDTDMIR